MTPAELAQATADAYSADRYGPTEWLRCAEILLDMGLSPKDAETVLRSKVMRWAADQYATEHDDERDYPTAECLTRALAEWPRPLSGLGLPRRSALLKRLA